MRSVEFSSALLFPLNNSGHAQQQADPSLLTVDTKPFSTNRNRFGPWCSADGRQRQSSCSSRRRQRKNAVDIRVRYDVGNGQRALSEK
jgi:hypothetical protein